MVVKDMVFKGKGTYASVLDPRQQTWRHEYPFTQHYLEVQKGLAMHYVDHGPPATDRKGTVVMFHGNPTWSFYYRNLIKALSREYRCVAMDHIGCGLSSRPGRKAYGWRLRDRIEDAEVLLDHLGIERATFVVHDWGGAIGLGVAGRRPERVERVVVMNSAAFRASAIPFSIDSCRIPLLGEAMVLGFNGFARVAQWRAVTHVQVLGGIVRDGYLAPYNNVHRRIATLEFVHDIPMHPGDRSWHTLCQVEHGLKRLDKVPMLLIWGDDDFCFTADFRREWQRRFPNAQCYAYKDGGHYILEDKREEAIGLIQAFMDRGARR